MPILEDPLCHPERSSLAPADETLRGKRSGGICFSQALRDGSDKTQQKTEGTPSNLAMKQPSRNRRPGPSEEGYMLVVVIFMMAILILSLSIALPRVRESIQRDREEETMQRGKQYVRAIQLYYRKFNAYPPNVDALVKTNNIRFLRKKYIDPTTGKDEWKAIMYCQNKTPQAMGFFGQPLAGAGCGASGGIGPAGGNTGLNGSTSGPSGARAPPRAVDCSTAAPTLRPTPAQADPKAQLAAPTPPLARQPAGNEHKRDNHKRLRLRFIQQPHRQRSELWRRRHHRLLSAKPKTVDPRLQEEEPL